MESYSVYALLLNIYFKVCLCIGKCMRVQVPTKARGLSWISLELVRITGGCNPRTVLYLAFRMLLRCIHEVAHVNSSFTFLIFYY